MTLEEYIDHELVATHLGTLESFESPEHALKALFSWYQSVGAYFENARCRDVIEQMHYKVEGRR